MRKTLLSILFSVAFAGMVQAQITKCKASTFSFREKAQGASQWTRWSSPVNVDILISIDDANKRMQIFSDQEQVYDIIRDHGVSKNRKGENEHKWECINEKGIRCYVYVINTASGSELSVEFSDLSWKYKVRII
ncbi:MAG: hypothetical protein JNL72_10955 [Flavipsychrobacter sp.]|nr:hypothetical protein [Flavipsychrobacter sp.]